MGDGFPPGSRRHRTHRHSGNGLAASDPIDTADALLILAYGVIWMERAVSTSKDTRHLSMIAPVAWFLVRRLEILGTFRIPRHCPRFIDAALLPRSDRL